MAKPTKVSKPQTATARIATPTFDPCVFIESESPGYIRYWRSTDLRRWEVHGACKNRGYCIIGANLPDGTQPTTLQAVLDWFKANPQGEANILDVPVTPEFDTCCAASGDLTFVELAPGPYQPG